MKNRAGLTLVIAAGILAGCASTKQFVPFPDQSKQVENPDKARIYVVRPDGLGFAVSMNVNDGPLLVGETGPRGYLCWERDPGQVEVAGKAENTSRLTLTVEKGLAYYIKQQVKMGFFIARNKLLLLREVDGKAALERCTPPKTGQ